MTPALAGVASGATLHPHGDGFDKTMDAIEESGCEALRTSAMWAQVEPRIGSGYDWTVNDAMVAACEKRGMGLVLEAGGRGDNILYAPGVSAAYVKFWAALADRYEGRLLGTAPQNEIEHVKVDKNPSAHNYVTQVARPGYEAIKKVAPTMLVGTSGLGGDHNDGDVGTSADFLSLCYDEGIKGYFDMLMFHPYTHELTPSQSMATKTRGWWLHHLCRQTMNAHGDHAKQSWLTEYGVPVGDRREPHTTEADQAAILTEAFAMHRQHPYAGPMFWFTWQDNPAHDQQDYGAWMGLVRADGTPKPALEAFREIAG